MPFQHSGTSFLLLACESHRQQPAKLLSNSPMLIVTLRNTVFSFSRPSNRWVQIWSSARLVFICSLWLDPFWQMLHDLNTYLHKAIPDTKLTIRKYLDVKFEYLVRWQRFGQLCFTVPKLLWRLSSVLCEHLVSFSRTAWRSKKWMMRSTAVLWVDIFKFPHSPPCHLEQWISFFSMQAMGEPLYRVSTGNYEYRLVLRCRQEARARFAKMRKDVMEKIELLDQKHGLFFVCFWKWTPQGIHLNIKQSNIYILEQSSDALFNLHLGKTFSFVFNLVHSLNVIE